MKKSMKIGAVLAGIALAAGALAGCSATQNAAGTTGELFEKSITLEDGQDVTCVMMIGYGRGGLSCDWGGASE